MKKKIIKSLKKDLCNQLEKQTLNDGAHFELSPMYHTHILLRLTDLINLLEFQNLDNKLVSFLKKKLSLMNSWLENITYNNGLLPNINDSTINIYPNHNNVLNYSKSQVNSNIKTSLSDSGLRMIKNYNYELFIDASNIKSKYQPGHSHADTFNYELHIEKDPIIVDTGISTYTDYIIRNNERSTKSHNTVVINDMNSSNIWKLFRMGKQAEVISLNENKNSLEAVHDGYLNIGNYHKRKWIWNKNNVKIIDSISGINNKNYSYIHFHPSFSFYIKNDMVIGDNVRLNFKYFEKVFLFKYKYAKEFNKRVNSMGIKVLFKNKLETTINF